MFYSEEILLSILKIISTVNLVYKINFSHQGNDFQGNDFSHNRRKILLTGEKILQSKKHSHTRRKIYAAEEKLKKNNSNP